MGNPADDLDGLESLPLKLAIVAVVATLSVLPASQALAGLENREFARKAELQLNLIVTTAQVLTVQGPGNVKTISLDFESHGELGFDRLTVGDRPESANSSAVRLTLNNGAVMARTATDPPCVLCSGSKTAFVSMQGAIDLRMTAELDGDTTVITVEAV